MSQLRTLIWLKWRIFRNSLRSKKAVVNRAAVLLGALAALALASVVAVGLGVAGYVLSRPDIAAELQRKGPPGALNTPVEFIFFSIFAFLYLIWATLPLSVGSAQQFDPGRMLMYPIRLGKLFAVDFLSELTSLQSIFAIPAIFALGIGVGLGTGSLGQALLVTVPIAGCGIALSKWVATSIGYLMRGKRTRGETLIAIIGGVAGLGGALIGQIAPLLIKHSDAVKQLRWTPPGAAAFALTNGLTHDMSGYIIAMLGLYAYTILLVCVTWWFARRSALGLGGRKRTSPIEKTTGSSVEAGWHLPFVSPQVSAIVEKEFRYVTRNAQLRMMALMPLILIVVRFMNSRRINRAQAARDAAGAVAKDFLTYGRGLIATGGVLYVFLILAGISCNLFAFEESGMRTLILSPAKRRDILLGKNISTTFIALLFSVVLLTINELVFRDVTGGTLVFVALCFVIFAALMSIIGNWLSIRFPKRMRFGKRSDVSGVVGLLIIPMILLLALSPLAATAAGYVAESLAAEYATLGVLATLFLCFYFLVIGSQGESLERHEIEILEAVREPQDE